MSFLTPLGFLGLIGLIVLIIIYLIKPNYQNKIISSTFVWKLSLKYRKKRIPINKLRNILLFICQVLVITACAAVLVQPIISTDKPEPTDDKVIIIDASASMMSKSGELTRFERAVTAVRAYSDEVFEKGGRVSVILAGDKASFVIQEADLSKREELNDELDKLIDVNSLACTWGEPDVSGAIKLSEEITGAYPGVEVVMYTDTAYTDAGDVTVLPISDISEWNAAVLDVRAVIEENNFYRYEIDVAAYGGVNRDIQVFCEIYGVNDQKDTISLKGTLRCENGVTSTLIVSQDESVSVEPVSIYSYESVFVYITEEDSLDKDNSFYLYGGEKPKLRVQYASSLANNYFATTLMVMRDQLQYRWNIDFVQVKADETPAEEGFDIYIYEHTMPAALPKDGIVILADPDLPPYSSGFRLGTVANIGETTLSSDGAHPVLNRVTAENITITRYTRITSYDGYTPILYCNNDPVMMVKNEDGQKIAVMSFSLNYSNLPVLMEFPLMMYNLIEYFSPSTFTEYVFDVNDEITLNSRTDMLEISTPDGSGTLTDFPTSLPLTAPGAYTVIQNDMSGDELAESFFVRIPHSESDISSTEDTLPNPYYFTDAASEARDPILYIALALVLLLLAEWWLHQREQN